MSDKNLDNKQPQDKMPWFLVIVLGIGIGFAMIVLLVGSLLVSQYYKSHIKNNNKLAITNVTTTLPAATDQETQPQSPSQDKSLKIDKNKPYATYKVKVLLTVDGQAGTGLYSDRYLDSLEVNGDPSITNQLAAFGAAYQVWLAPKNWIGAGVDGTDGNFRASFYPKNSKINTSTGDVISGSHIYYLGIPECEYCYLRAAAPFFPAALTRYNSRGYNDDGSDNIIMPKGLNVKAISKTLKTYTMPDKEGLSTVGVVYYNPAADLYNAPEGSMVNPYESAEFVLPTADASLANFLVQYFIASQGLK